MEKVILFMRTTVVSGEVSVLKYLFGSCVRSVHFLGKQFGILDNIENFHWVSSWDPKGFDSPTHLH